MSKKALLRIKELIVCGNYNAACDEIDLLLAPKAPAVPALWRTDFEEYKRICIEGFRKIVTDKDLLGELRAMVPEFVCVVSTLRASARSYWLTVDGWENKKRSVKKKDGPDWMRTARSIMRQNYRWVKTEQEESVALG